MELLFPAPDLHPPAVPSTASSPSSSSSATAAMPSAETAAPPMEDVVAALEHAALAVKRLSSPPPAADVDASVALLALVSLRNAHQVIASFLSQLEARTQPVAEAEGEDEPMFDREVEEAAADAAASSRDVEEVGERMRECGLQNKRRRKRLVSLSWPMGRVSHQETESGDPMDRRRLAIDLVFQFHG